MVLCVEEKDVGHNPHAYRTLLTLCRKFSSPVTPVTDSSPEPKSMDWQCQPKWHTRDFQLIHICGSAVGRELVATDMDPQILRIPILVYFTLPRICVYKS